MKIWDYNKKPISDIERDYDLYGIVYCISNGRIVRKEYPPNTFERISSAARKKEKEMYKKLKCSKCQDLRFVFRGRK